MEMALTEMLTGMRATYVSTAEHALVKMLNKRLNEGKGRTFIALDMPSLIEELDLPFEIRPRLVRKAISRLHRAGVINCGHASRDDADVMLGGHRTYKITLVSVVDF